MAQEKDESNTDLEDHVARWLCSRCAGTRPWTNSTAAEGTSHGMIAKQSRVATSKMRLGVQHKERRVGPCPRKRSFPTSDIHHRRESTLPNPRRVRIGVHEELREPQPRKIAVQNLTSYFSTGLERWEPSLQVFECQQFSWFLRRAKPCFPLCSLSGRLRAKCACIGAFRNKI